MESRTVEGFCRPRWVELMCKGINGEVEDTG